MDDQGCGPVMHVHNYPSDGRMEQALKLLREIRKEQRTMAVKHEDIVARVDQLVEQAQRTGTVVDSAVVAFREQGAMLAQIHAEMQEAKNNGTEEELQAQLDRLGAVTTAFADKTGALAAAIAAPAPADGGEDDGGSAAEPDDGVNPIAPDPAANEPIGPDSDTVPGPTA